MSYRDQLTPQNLLEIYRWLVLTRTFEDQICTLWSKPDTLAECPHGSQGQEAIAVGACYGLRRDDQVLPSLRTRGAFLVKGISTRVQMAGVYAKVTGAAKGKFTAHHMGDPAAGVLIGSGIVGASITVATGAALAFKLRKRDNIVVDFFGDGGAQRGDFHEGLNFAGAFKLPIVYVLENNGFAEYTPVAKHLAAANFACRAEGYGFPGYKVDGNDVLAVYEEVQRAAARARAGEGPTLLECVTYRMRGHSEVDRPEDLRDRAEIAQWRTRDPVELFRSQLLERGILTRNLVDKFNREAEEEVQDAVRYAEESATPPLEELYRDVYAPEDPELVVGLRA